MLRIEIKGFIILPQLKGAQSVFGHFVVKLCDLA